MKHKRCPVWIRINRKQNLYGLYKPHGNLSKPASKWTRILTSQCARKINCERRWLRVTAKLRAAGSTDVTVKAYECNLKWRNMLAIYSKNTERSKRLGAQSVHWEFFKAMHEVLGKSREEIEAQHRSKLNGTKLGKAIASKWFTPILLTPSLIAASFTSRPPRMSCSCTWSSRRGR